MPQQRGIDNLAIYAIVRQDSPGGVADGRIIVVGDAGCIQHSLCRPKAGALVLTGWGFFWFAPPGFFDEIWQGGATINPGCFFQDGTRGFVFVDIAQS